MLRELLWTLFYFVIGRDNVLFLVDVDRRRLRTLYDPSYNGYEIVVWDACNRTGMWYVSWIFIGDFKGWFQSFYSVNNIGKIFLVPNYVIHAHASCNVGKLFVVRLLFLFWAFFECFLCALRVMGSCENEEKISINKFPFFF